MGQNKSLVVVFDSTFESLLSTALICEAMEIKAIHKDCFNSFMIAEQSQIIRTDRHEGSLKFGDALRIYKKRKGHFCLNEYELREIRTLIKWCLRYKPSDNSKFTLALKVLRRCLVEGPNIIMSQVTLEGREIYKRSRKVRCEYHKACGFLRLHVSGGFLFAEAEFEHAVEDLVVRFWSKRYPEKTIVLFSKGKWKPLAYIGRRGKVRVVEGEKVTVLRSMMAEVKETTTEIKDPKETDDEAQRIYEVFYDAQYIPARRNKKLATRFVPKKFSKRFRMKEGVKIACGIQETKLDLFFTNQADDPSLNSKRRKI
jgi:probable DNA metabolism protein